jgi:anti-anti-sigma factor
MILNEALDRYNGAHPQAPASASRLEGSIVLALSGELDMKASSDLAPVFDAVFLVCPPRGRIVLDLSHVGYITSTGVGLLTTTMVAAEKRSISLVLLDIPPRIRNIMDALGLMSFFQVEVSDG